MRTFEEELRPPEVDSRGVSFRDSSRIEFERKGG
jgi:hypothetical protein